MTSTEKSAGLSLKLAGLLLLVGLPLGLRLSSIDHGQPRNYLPDTHVVRSALGMANERNPVPPVRRYSSYPNVVPYMLLPCYALQFAVGRVRGDWSGAEAFGEHVLAHPETVHWTARLLVALLGALTPFVVLRGARAAEMRGGAWVAAWLVATGLLHTHFSVQERPWVPMVFFMALAAWAAVVYERSDRDGRARPLYLAGCAAGLAFGCHQAGLLALLLPGLAWFLGPGGWSGAELGRRLARGVITVALFGVVALILGHPYLLVHGATETGAVVMGEEALDEGGISIGGQAFMYRFRLESLTGLTRSLFGYDPALLLLALPGLALILSRRGARCLGLFALVWAALFLTNHNDHVRYLLPLSVLLAFPAGLFSERLLKSHAGLLALLPFLAFALVQDLRLVALLGRADTRAEMEELLADLPTGSLVAIDRYGPLGELDRASLELKERLRKEAGSSLYRREAYRLELLRSVSTGGAGIGALHVEDLFVVDEEGAGYALRAGLESLGSSPEEALAGLGVTHLLLVARHPGDMEANPLHELVRGRAPILVLDPSAGSGTAEAHLPVEMEFPLTGLWSVERPGPLLSLHDLR